VRVQTLKTDSLLYELFQFDPQSLIQLLRLNPEGQYAFESIAIKTTEKRLDGFFKRIDGEGPHLFLETQGYDDPKIFWRLFRKICTFYEQRDDSKPFIAIVLFLDEKYDPGPFVLSCITPCQFFRVNLIDCLRALESAPGTLTVLKPLVLASKEELAAAIPQWKVDIQSLNLPEAKHKSLVELLEYAIVQRFPELTEEEVNTMLHLTPIEQTTVGKQIFGRGELIGKIQLGQQLLKQSLSPKEELAQKTAEELKSMLRQLETELEASLNVQ
jgi:predicted transposase YdaD